jgi:hypothetical protein
MWKTFPTFNKLPHSAGISRFSGKRSGAGSILINSGIIFTQNVGNLLNLRGISIVVTV